ncbi:MAG: cytidylate kinase, partial [Planctomycetaceae bacterium]|nr:cytidylate kinase [Planctomycetaceae bacterium]
MIVTIDGPAGAGKSSVARALAAELGFDFLDTGAMYRSVAWLALESEISWDDSDQVVSLVSRMDLALDENRVTLNGEDVSQAIRDP